MSDEGTYRLKVDESTQGNSESLDNNREESGADSIGVEGSVNVFPVLWQMIRAHRSKMFFSISYGVLSGMLQVSPAIFVALIVYALQNGDMTQAIYYAIGMIIAAVLCAGLYALSTLVSHIIAAEVQASVRGIIAEKLSQVPLGYFQKNSRESIKKLIIDDVEELEDGVAHLIPELTSALVTPCLIVCLMLWLDPLLALMAVFPTVAGFFAFAIIIRGGDALNDRFYQAKTQITETLDEVVSAIPVVKSYNRGDSALKRVHQSFSGFKALVDEWIEAMMVKSSWFYLLTSSNLLLVGPVGYWLYLEQKLSLSMFVFFILTSLSLSTLTASLFGIMSRLRGQEGVINRYCKLMSEPEFKPVSAPLDDEVNGYEVSFEAVHFSYDSHELNTVEGGKQRVPPNANQEAVSDGHLPVVIENLSLRLPQGSFTAIVGPSGSGKSTLAYLLARFWDVQRGAVCIGGVDIRQLSAKKLATLTAFVLQDVFIFTRSVRDNICIGMPQASDEQVIAAAKAAYAHEFIMALPQGYDTVLTDGNGLSLGQKQRLSIARAVMQDAAVLVLDEATAYADPQSEAEVQKALSRLMRGRTVMVIAHRLSTITAADQIIYIDRGKILEKGSHDELLSLDGQYASQWQRHTKAKAFKVTDN